MLCIEENGYRVIENKLKEEGIVNKKGNSFSAGTIKICYIIKKVLWL